MKFEHEITVKVNISRDDLLIFLNDNNYRKIDSYIVFDEYYAKNEVDLDNNLLDILNECILVRSIDDRKHYLVYKYKEYDEFENIVSQNKTKVQVINREDANTFLNALGYKDLIKIVDCIDVYEKDGFEICVQYVNDKYLFIEIEENDKYKSTYDMIKKLEKTKIDYDKSNYFVKKAQIVFEEKYRIMKK